MSFIGLSNQSHQHRSRNMSSDGSDNPNQSLSLNSGRFCGTNIWKGLAFNRQLHHLRYSAHFWQIAACDVTSFAKCYNEPSETNGGGGNRTRCESAANASGINVCADGLQSQSAHSQHRCGRAWHEASQADNLSVLAGRWFELPEYIQHSIMALVDAAGSMSPQG
jgi:hypothetical protein